MNKAGKILIVEDNKIAMLNITHFLKASGLEGITACESGLSAVEAFKREPEAFSLVLLDMGLPDINGLEVAARIRDIEKQLRIEDMLVPIILTSSHVTQEQKQESVKHGITSFFNKPLTEKTRGAILKIMEIKNLVTKPKLDSSVSYFEA